MAYIRTSDAVRDYIFSEISEKWAEFTGKNESVVTGVLGAGSTTTIRYDAQSALESAVASAETATETGGTLSSRGDTQSALESAVASAETVTETGGTLSSRGDTPSALESAVVYVGTATEARGTLSSRGDTPSALESAVVYTGTVMEAEETASSWLDTAFTALGTVFNLPADAGSATAEYIQEISAVKECFSIFKMDFLVMDAYLQTLQDLQTQIAVSITAVEDAQTKLASSWSGLAGDQAQVNLQQILTDLQANQTSLDTAYTFAFNAKAIYMQIAEQTNELLLTVQSAL